MASKALATIALLLSFNMLFLSMANAEDQPKCQKDRLILKACTNVLGDFLSVRVGNPDSKCCTLINGLADLEVDPCLCTVVQADVLGLAQVSAPVQWSLLLDFCDLKPRPYSCN